MSPCPVPVPLPGTPRVDIPPGWGAETPVGDPLQTIIQGCFFLWVWEWSFPLWWVVLCSPWGSLVWPGGPAVNGVPHLGVPFFGCAWNLRLLPAGGGARCADMGGTAYRGMGGQKEGGITTLHPFWTPPPFGGGCTAPLPVGKGCPSWGGQQKWGRAVPPPPPQHVCAPLCPPPRCMRRSSGAASRSWRGCGSAVQPRRGRRPRQRSGGSRSCSSRCCSCSRRRSSCRRTWPSCCRSGSCWSVAAPPSSVSAPSWHPGWRRPSGR